MLGISFMSMSDACMSSYCRAEVVDKHFIEWHLICIFPLPPTPPTPAFSSYPPATPPDLILHVMSCKICSLPLSLAADPDRREQLQQISKQSCWLAADKESIQNVSTFFGSVRSFLRHIAPIYIQQGKQVYWNVFGIWEDSSGSHLVD